VTAGLHGADASTSAGARQPQSGTPVGSQDTQQHKQQQQQQQHTGFAPAEDGSDSEQEQGDDDALPGDADQQRSRKPPSAYETTSRNVRDRVRRITSTFQSLVAWITQALGVVLFHPRVICSGQARGVLVLSVPLRGMPAQVVLAGCEDMPVEQRSLVEDAAAAVARLLSVGGVFMEVRRLCINDMVV
jgi:hypothetical protein